MHHISLVPPRPLAGSSLLHKAPPSLLVHESRVSLGLKHKQSLVRKAGLGEEELSPGKEETLGIPLSPLQWLAPI